MFSLLLAKLQNETRMKLSLRARGPSWCFRFRFRFRLFIVIVLTYNKIIIRGPYAACVFCVLGGLALDCAVGRSCSPPTVLIKKHDGKRLADDTALFSLVQTTVMLRSLLRCFIFYLNSCVYVFKLCMNIPKHYDSAISVLDKLLL